MKTKNINENRFYVYAYLDIRKPGKYIYEDYSFDYEPFYIGKGTGYRKSGHLKSSSLKSQSCEISTVTISKILNGKQKKNRFGLSYYIHI